MIRWMESGTLSTCFVEMELELCWAFNREFHWYHTLKILVLYLDYGGLYMNIHIPVCTAQGGGGSFKDRKPIGEVRCCESWVAEQTH